MPINSHIHAVSINKYLHTLRYVTLRYATLHYIMCVYIYIFSNLPVQDATPTGDTYISR